MHRISLLLVIMGALIALNVAAIDPPDEGAEFIAPGEVPEWFSEMKFRVDCGGYRLKAMVRHAKLAGRTVEFRLDGGEWELGEHPKHPIGTWKIKWFKPKNSPGEHTVDVRVLPEGWERTAKVMCP